MTSLVKNIWINIKFTGIGSLRFCFDAIHIIEKIFWLLLGITGLIFMSLFVYDLVKSWQNSRILSTRKWVNLSEVDFPAITFCHQGNTRLEFADRLVKAANDKGPKIRRLRNLFLKTSVEYMISSLPDYFQKAQNISSFYQFCLNSNPYCDTLHNVFGYAKDKNMTVELFY